MIMTDDPATEYAAGRLLPPSAINLVYPNTFDLLMRPTAKLTASMREYKVNFFLFTGGYKGERFYQWLKTFFPHSFTAIEGESIWHLPLLYTRNPRICRAEGESS